MCDCLSGYFQRQIPALIASLMVIVTVDHFPRITRVYLSLCFHLVDTRGHLQVAISTFHTYTYLPLSTNIRGHDRRERGGKRKKAIWRYVKLKGRRQSKKITARRKQRLVIVKWLHQTMDANLSWTAKLEPKWNLESSVKTGVQLAWVENCSRKKDRRM